MLFYALSLLFEISDIGNGELQQAFNAAIGQLHMNGEIQLLYQKYFAYYEDSSHKIFERLFQGQFGTVF